MYQGFFHVINAGPTASGPTEVKIRPLDKWPDGSTDDRWFINSASVPRETLATALAAIATGKSVYCEIADELTQYSQVTRFILNAD